MKMGVILNNIGTPKSASRADVAYYLDEFLMDPDVIPLPWFFRALLVKGLIVPFRSRSSSRKYTSIWTHEGSPLLVHTRNLQKKLQDLLGEQFIVEIGMRYGEPSLTSAIVRLETQGIQKAIFVPMYPQYAEATTGSALRYLRSLKTSIEFKDLPYFYTEDFFLKPSIEVIQQALHGKAFDHLLFSYHGLPKAQNIGRFGKPYDEQCKETSSLIAGRLGLAANQFSTAFQSRLGPDRWLTPATRDEIAQLVLAGKKRIAIACPSFTTDCLETLEEIGHELRAHFQALGGFSLELMPCLNDSDFWVQSLAEKLNTELDSF